MAHNLSEQFLSKLANTQGQQLLTFIKIFWDSGSIIYSEQEEFYDTSSSQWSLPALMSVGSFQTALKLNNNGTRTNFNVTIDDSDGHLHTIFNQEVLNGTQVELALNFSGLTRSEQLTLGVGSIDSDTISWDESLRVVSFGVENVLVSKNVSFKPYPEMIARQEEDFVAGFVPFVFGSPKRVPALKVFAGEKALTTFTREFDGNAEAKAPDSVPTYKDAYVLDSLEGFEIGVPVQVHFYEVDRLGFAGAGKNITDGTPYKIMDGTYVFITDHVVDEFTDVNLLPFDMASDFAPTEANLAVDDPTNTFTAFLHWWVDLDPATKNLATEEYYLNFEDFSNRPSLFGYKVVEHVEEPVASGKFRIKLSHQPRWGTIDQERDPSRDNKYKDWWSTIIVDQTTGEFDDGIAIQSRAKQIRHDWNVNFLDYTQVDRSGAEVHESDLSTMREEIKQTTGAVRASLTQVVEVDLEDSNKVIFNALWLPEEKDTTLATYLAYTWQIADETGYKVDKRRLDLFNDTQIHEAIMIPVSRNISKFITNIFQAGEATTAPTDIAVYAKSNFTSNLLPVLTGSLTIAHTAVVEGNISKQTILDITPALAYTRFDGFYSGEVFVNHSPAYLAHDGKGGTVSLDSENAIDVIEWLFNTYTNLLVINDDATLEALREKLSDRKMAFYVAREVDAISLANIIAWESKIALRYFNNTVNIIDLNIEPVIEHTFDVSNVELKTIKLGFMPSNQIITDFRFHFKSDKDEGEGDVIVFNNNINRYGKNTQFIEVLTLDNQDDVFDLVKFWGNRLSKAWRIVSFRASPEALKLQPYDAVSVNIPAISSNPIIGFIEKVEYEPNSMEVTVSLTLASVASDTLSNGDPATDPSYWTGLDTLKLNEDKRVGIVSELEGASIKKFSLTDLNTLKPFERRL